MPKKHIAIVDAHIGNVHSVANAIAHVTHHHARLTSDAKAIANADAVIFPGQGAAATCMQAIHRAGLAECLKTAAREKPFFGICMGLQVLMEESSENAGVACLGVVAGKVARLVGCDNDTATLRLPHMGWNAVRQAPHPLWAGIADDAPFYFVHSYAVVPTSAESVVGTTTYGAPFISALAVGNLFAIQAHPEKSGADGLRLLANFCERI